MLDEYVVVYTQYRPKEKKEEHYVIGDPDIIVKKPTYKKQYLKTLLQIMYFIKFIL